MVTRGTAGANVCANDVSVAKMRIIRKLDFDIGILMLLGKEKESDLIHKNKPVIYIIRNYLIFLYHFKDILYDQITLSSIISG